MRIAVTSDVHVDSNGEVVLEALASRVRVIAPDVLVVAGDIATGPVTYLKTLLALRAAAGEVVVVAGNHDVWSSPAQVAAGMDAWKRLDVLLPALCREAGVHDLDAGPVELGGIGFAGTIGWWDLSLRDPDLEVGDAYGTGVYGGVRWLDHTLAAWGAAPEVVSERLRARLADQLAALRTDRIVAVTHVLPFEAQVHRASRPVWRFLNAFMGSVALGEVLRADPRVVLAIAGHTHLGSDLRFGGLRAVVSPLGYRREWRGASAEEAVERAVKVVEL
ncbi:MAG: metallophosphoesterase family protein [Myxococcota bacterium]